MAVEKVACPYCGEVTNITVPPDRKLARVEKNVPWYRSGATVDGGCPNGHDFVASTKPE